MPRHGAERRVGPVWCTLGAVAVTPWLKRLVRRSSLAYPNEVDWDEVIDQDPWEGRKLQVVYGRVSASGVAEDDAVTTHHFVNYTGGVIDDSWTDTDFTNIESNFDAFWTAIKGGYKTFTTLLEYRWYKFGPDVGPPNPAVRVVPKSVPGTSTGNLMPPQVAMSITERTPLRKQWGRFYLPAPVTAAGDANGRILAVEIDALADAAEALYEACFADDIIPVVYSPRHEVAIAPLEIQVDDVFDVIRSRRYENTLTRDRRPV